MIQKDKLIGCIMVVLVLSFGGSIFAGEIHEAAKAGDLAKIKYILASNPSRVSVQDVFGYTPLHWAALMEHKEVVKYLLEQGAEVNVPGLDGCTPLHSAANHEAVAIIGELIKHGAVVDARDGWGNTPLHIACRSGRYRASQILLFQGANLNALTNDNWTPLHYLMRAGHKRMAEKFTLNLNANTDILDDAGKGPLDYEFTRPYPIDIDSSLLNEYIGEYYLGGSFVSKVWKEDGKLWVADYAYEPLYYIGPDSFYCEDEPWYVYFTRNEAGKVDSIHLSFLRNTVGGKKVADNFKPDEPKPKLGLAGQSLLMDEVTDMNKRAVLNLGGTSDTVAAIVTYVLEDTPADKAGIKRNDIIVSFNGGKVTGIDKLYQLIREAPSGQEVPVEFIRRGGVTRVNVHLN